MEAPRFVAIGDGSVKRFRRSYQPGRLQDRAAVEQMTAEEYLLNVRSATKNYHDCPLANPAITG